MAAPQPHRASRLTAEPFAGRALPMVALGTSPAASLTAFATPSRSVRARWALTGARQRV
ncbi:hypothetical protein [Halorubrum sp. SY-15]|uniref:hypothetical protein n=1 Tax=Halorubrum sp. SY-15 TaxID=3402277 RepID=UPI003EBF5D6D